MRLLLRWILNAAALYGIAYAAPRLGMLPGFAVEGVETAFIAVAILALLNLTVVPIIKLLTLPLTCLTFGLFSLIINALMMLVTSQVVNGFDVGGPLNALMASIIFSILSTILNMLFNREED